MQCFASSQTTTLFFSGVGLAMNCAFDRHLDAGFRPTFKGTNYVIDVQTVAFSDCPAHTFGVFVLDKGPLLQTVICSSCFDKAR